MAGNMGGDLMLAREVSPVEHITPAHGPAGGSNEWVSELRHCAGAGRFWNPVLYPLSYEGGMRFTTLGVSRQMLLAWFAVLDGTAILAHRTRSRRYGRSVCAVGAGISVFEVRWLHGF